MVNLKSIPNPVAAAFIVLLVFFGLLNASVYFEPAFMEFGLIAYIPTLFVMYSAAVHINLVLAGKEGTIVKHRSFLTFEALGLLLVKFFGGNIEVLLATGAVVTAVLSMALWSKAFERFMNRG